MKLKLFVSVCTGFILGSALGSVVWAAPAIQVPADTYAFGTQELQVPLCSSQVLEVSTQGNTTHLKLLNLARMVSLDPRLTGQATVEVEVIFHNNGHISGHGSLVLQPSGFAGSWEADFNISAPRGRSIDLNGLTIIKDSHINAHGTGVFTGQWFFFEHGIDMSPGPHQIPVDDPDGEGGCEFMGEVWSGRIFNPNAA